MKSVTRSTMRSIIAALFLLMPFAKASAQYPTEWKSSPHFRAYVNGKEIHVSQSPIAAYVIIPFDKPVKLLVKANQDLKWADAKPRQGSLKVGADSTVSMMIDHPTKFSLEVNGSRRMPLLVFAQVPPARPAAQDSALVLTSGKIHDLGIVDLKSNRTIYLEEGAILKGAIHALNQRHIAVKGLGIIDGSDENIRHKIEFRDCSDALIEGVTLHDSKTWQIVPIHSNGVIIRDVNIVSDNGGDDGIDIARSKKVTIEKCFIRAKDDCIAIKANFDYKPDEIVDSVLVQNCVLWNGDWGNGMDIGFELRAKEVKNVVARNCDFIHVQAGAAIAIHNADQSHVHDILFDNIRIEDTDQKLFDFAIFLSQYSVDAPDDWSEKQKRYLHGAWDGVLHVSDKQRAFHSAYRGTISNVTLRNIQVTGALPFSIMSGFDEKHLVKNVTVSNLTVNGEKIKTLQGLKLFQAHAANIVVQ